MQLAANGQVQKSVVRNTAPQGERQARRQLDIGNAIDGAGSGARGIGLDSEQEIGAYQCAFQRGANALIEVSRGACAFIEAEQRLNIVVSSGAAISAAC